MMTQAHPIVQKEESQWTAASEAAAPPGLCHRATPETTTPQSPAWLPTFNQAPRSTWFQAHAQPKLVPMNE